MKSNLDNFFRPKKTEGDKPPSKKVGYLIILGLTGVFLIIVSNIFSSEDEPDLDIQPQGETENIANADDAAEMSSSDISHVEERLGQELAAMLNKIQLVTEAEVMVNLNATSEQIYEKNTTKGQQITDESDRNGGTRKIEDNTEDSQVVTIRKGDQEMPLLVQTKQPEVRGVFVVAKGADQPSVKNQIVEAVSRVLDVPTHKISVMPKN
ncbi:stage III sporulation protein AG [Oceanobacillus polygoni]|uniref:Stage III sporulation protein AG n=1 Tax=Oceanobacillus polygoni TaxID=1235259 RepID=A0A9X0YSV4_9BACI|nr:stage III sporulation protein AG [Oceanobacillus polygoni]MBP2078227.1 stage III sporulation protein AG [Oceanobacillus polygoni]